MTNTLDPQGPTSFDDSSSAHHGQIVLFEQAYRTAFADAQEIATGKRSPPTSPADLTSIRARHMAVEGVHLVDAYCALFFRDTGDNQKWLLVARDMVAALGSIATGALALVSHNTGTAAGVTALTTAALYSGVDIYTRNFLFGSDNVDSVRVMTMNALASDTAGALPDKDNSIWTFGGAAQVVTQHQAICTPAAIRALVLAAIKGGTFVAAPTAAQTEAQLNAPTTSAAGAAQAKVPAAADAAVAVAPAVQPAAVPAANAAAAAASQAASVAAARPGATPAEIATAAKDAAVRGATAVLSQVNAPPTSKQQAAQAVANVIGPAAASGASTAAPAAPNQPPATRQQQLILVQPNSPTAPIRRP